jgi:hypothetical protein
MLNGHIYTRFFAGLLCLQLLIPGVLWHSLSGHHDSGHCELPQERMLVGEQHLHCPALDLVLQVASPEELGLLFKTANLLFISAVPELLSLHHHFLIHHFLRGPPDLFQ